jgi:hypothetical protein
MDFISGYAACVKGPRGNVPHNESNETSKLTFFQNSVETGLPFRITAAVRTPFGKLTVESILSDYKTAGGINCAMKSTQTIVEFGLTQEIQVDSLVYNRPIDETIFAVPEGFADK